MTGSVHDDQPRLFEAFIKSVQFIGGLKTQQDIRDSLGKLITTHLPASWAAFAERDYPGDGVLLVHSTAPDPALARAVLTDEVVALVSDVLDNGFLASEVVAAPEPSTTVFLPIVQDSRPRSVMLVGHPTADPLPRELLDIYLAIAGLAGSTLERLQNEIELNRHRAHLEELVAERTAELQDTNAQLEIEVGERTAAQRALHAERERLAVTLRSIGDGVIATDTEANVVLLNSIAEELTGWTLEEAAGRPVAEVFHIVNEETRQPADIPVRRALETGTVVELANHTVLIARDGTEVSVADSCAPIRAADGSIIGAVLVFRDVTEQYRAERLGAALNDINAVISATFDEDEILQAIVQSAADALGCEKALVHTRRDGHWEVTHASELAGRAAGMRMAVEEAPGFEAAAAEGVPVLLDGDRLHAAVPTSLVEALDAETLLFMPVVVKGAAVATLAFADLAPSASFAGVQLDFVRKLAASSALALENARLYAAEREIAETLQEALICVPQTLPGIAVTHHYHSATKAARVGGDFYDVFQSRPGKIGVLMGDVAGKGISAATLTVLVQNTIKTLARQGYSPAEVLERTNESICGETKDGVFVTVFFATLDTQTGLVDYCGAGHPPAMLRRRRGNVELLQPTSAVIGAFPGLSFEESVTVMGLGDTLVLYTDGVIEARRPDGEFFGEERLVSAIATVEADELTGHIHDTLMAFTGGDLNDDVAVLIVTRVAE